MKERPILFQPGLVRAIIAGEKTQTRRGITRLNGIGQITELCKSETPGWDFVFRDKRQRWNDLTAEQMLSRCPYGRPGDRLWVREAFCKLDPEHVIDGRRYAYRADSLNGGSDRCRQDYIALGYPYQWKPSIHMPRAASRVTLTVTEVRVERVQAITEDDARAEGVDRCPDAPAALSHRTSFAGLWDRINGADSWESNPWVWVVCFRQISSGEMARRKCWDAMEAAKDE